MGERSGTRPAAQGCRCAAIGGEEASSDCGGEVFGCQGDCVHSVVLKIQRCADRCAFARRKSRLGD